MEGWMEGERNGVREGERKKHLLIHFFLHAGKLSGCKRFQRLDSYIMYTVLYMIICTQIRIYLTFSTHVQRGLL